MIFHHEGIVTKDIERETKVYEIMGFKIESNFEDHAQNVRGRFMTKDEFRVELLEPLNDQSPLTSFANRGIKIYHHAFKTDDFKHDIDLLVEKSFLLIEEPKESVAFGGKIAFLLSPTGLMIELIES